MPLPKPPAAKAALLAATDYETQAAARTAKRASHGNVESAKAPLDLFGATPTGA